MSEFDNLIKKRAVALKYDSKNNRAPIIVASGMGYLAERITEAAAEAGVPVYEDDSLAVLLSQSVKRILMEQPILIRDIAMLSLISFLKSIRAL